MKPERLIVAAALLFVAGCSSRADLPARDAGVNRIFANVRGVT
jgi:hypothetical protein